MSQKNDDKDTENSNIPKGFEKFLKRASGKSETAKNEAAKKEETQPDKNAKKEQEEESISDDEGPDAKKQSKDQQKTPKEDPSSARNALNNFFFNPQGGPQLENWIIAALMSGALFWYMSGNNPSQEITYMDFINQYLSKN